MFCLQKKCFFFVRSTGFLADFRFQTVVFSTIKKSKHNTEDQPFSFNFILCVAGQSASSFFLCITKFLSFLSSEKTGFLHTKFLPKNIMQSKFIEPVAIYFERHYTPAVCLCFFSSFFISFFSSCFSGINLSNKKLIIRAESDQMSSKVIKLQIENYDSLVVVIFQLHYTYNEFFLRMI